MEQHGPGVGIVKGLNDGHPQVKDAKAAGNGQYQHPVGTTEIRDQREAGEKERGQSVHFHQHVEALPFAGSEAGDEVGGTGVEEEKQTYDAFDEGMK